MTEQSKEKVKKIKPSQYKPLVGKIFSLKKHKTIPLKACRKHSVTTNFNGKSNFDNSDGSMNVLVTDETNKDVYLLYSNKLYKISKFYLLHVASDSNSKEKLILTSLVSSYFSILSKHPDSPEEFLDFGKKLKNLQENFKIQ